MFQNAAIDVAIGLILMYLMLSLLCTVVNEFIATKLKLRASTLQDALPNLIDAPALLKSFYAHGLIASNSRAGATGSQTTLQAVISGPGLAAASAASAVKSVKAMLQAAPAAGAPPAADVAPPAAEPVKEEGLAANVSLAPTGPVKEEHPSYLAGGTVALALMDCLLKQQTQPQGTPAAARLATLETAISTLPVASKLKDALEASLLQANGDIDALRRSIATWFDDSMDRLSGAYKRKMKWIAMLIGLLIAIAFNADSFNVATTLWNDADRRASTIAVATQIAGKTLAEQSVDQKKLGSEVRTTETTLRSLPIGWNCQEEAYWTCLKQEIPKLTLVQILGWFLTAAALSLGAPFWFDLLNKFINLRGTGEKPVRDDKKTA